MKIKLLLILLLLPVLGFAQTYSFSTLVSFPSSSKKSAVNPYAPIIDSEGNLYGVSFYGGATNGGTVWKVTPKGVLSLVYSFVYNANNTGSFTPYGTLARDSSGNLYGPTFDGGIDGGWGTIFKVTPKGKETVLLNLLPEQYSGNLTLHSGNLYGYNDDFPYDTIFGISDTNGAPVSPCLYCYSFGGDGPEGNPIFDTAGNLFGDTCCGGATYNGYIFEITPEGVETNLYTFTGGTDGGGPNQKLTQDDAGNLYGVTSSGGSYGYGTVFKLEPTGALTVMYNFCATNCLDGSSPQSPLIIDTDGNLYGIAAGGTEGYGVIYKVTPSGVETVLWNAAGKAGLGSGLVMDSSGNLYGTTWNGGTSHNGSVYKLTKN